MFFLGIAYTIVEESLACKSFFDPNWPDLDIYSWYGRWLGVNWPWVIELINYHAIVSIMVPILLVESVFYDLRLKPWVGKRSLIFIAITLTL